jgi:two-component system, chemotaxis family, sensor kinase CheA
MAMIEDDEIIQVFIEESVEHMDGIETDLLDIEKDGKNINVDLVNKVFRAIHSVKGGAGFLGLEHIKELAHEMENILNLIRNVELVPDSNLINILLDATDKLNLLITNFSTSNDIDIADEVVMLKGATVSSLPEEEKEKVDNFEKVKLPSGKPVFEASTFNLDQAQKGGRILYLAEFDLLRDIERKDKTPMDVIKEIQQAGMLLESKIDIDVMGTLEEQSNAMCIPFFVLFATVLEQDLIGKLVNVDESKIYYFNKKREAIPVSGKSENEKVLQEEAPEPKRSETSEHLNSAVLPIDELVPEPENNGSEKLEEISLEAEVSVEKNDSKKAAPKPKTKATKASKKNTPATSGAEQVVNFASETLRVHVKDLDKLMTLAGELVLTRNQLLQTHVNQDEKGIENAISSVNLITSELQEAIMATRMQPIGNVFTKFQRVVRDLSRKMNKNVELIIEGEGVEMDKTIIEAIGDPLTHLVRNSVDHGIEEPEVRTALGKSPKALLRLSAFHEAGQVNIKIEDDGAGIDPAIIKAKALEKSFATESELAEMSDNEIIKLIFKPGFSTAKQVSDVSGRGVGMDVVFSNLNKIGGTVDLESKVNVGTTVSIKLPLTLAIIPSLIIKSENDRYAIPQVNLVELVRIPFAQVNEKIENIDNAMVMRLRGELLPLVQLKDAFVNDENNGARNNLQDLMSSGSDENSEAVNIVVVNAGSFNYGIIVNDLLDSEEIVVKPLGVHLRQLDTYSGATILGDGKAALILDVLGISNAMKLKPVKEKRSVEQSIEDVLNQTDSQSMIIVDNGNDDQFAIPLGLISRIEKIQKDELVQTSGKVALKYRGGNLIVLSIEEVANVKPRTDVEHPYVVIFQFGGREVGVIVSHIVDVVESNITVDEDTFRQPGIIGSAIIMDKITLMLDLYGLATAAMPERVVERQEEAKGHSKNKKNTILIVEDSKFFLKQIKGFTEDAGYNVLTALDGLEGLHELQEAKDEINLILTDIEMPNMDGIQFTREVRSKSEFHDMPILALTSVAGAEAEQVAIDAGIDEYLIKLDREKVISNIENYITNGRQN